MVGLLVWLAVACGDVGGVPPPPPPDLGPPMIELVNQGTGGDRPLEEVMLHSQLGNYRSATNVLEQPLAVGQRVEIRDIARGTYYVTVIRKPRSWGSERIALTTASAQAINSGRYLVWVFDESFRFHAPTANYGDAGPPDLSFDGPIDLGVDDLPVDVRPMDGSPADGGPDGDVGPSDARPDGDGGDGGPADIGPDVADAAPDAPGDV